MEVEDSGKNNTIEGRLSIKSVLKIQIHGRDNVIKFGPNINFVKGAIVLRGNNQIVEIAGENRISGRIVLSGHGSSVFIGEGTRNNSNIWMDLGEDEDSIRIGNNCLFSKVKFRTSEINTIHDVQTGERISPPGRIVLHDRVWIGEDALVLGGANVGSDCVIGACALVTGTVPPNSLAVGIPAKAIRSGIRWQRWPEKSAGSKLAQDDDI